MKKEKLNYEPQKAFEEMKRFLVTDSVSGREEEMADLFSDIAIKSGATVSKDGFGSVVAELGDKDAPLVSIVSHMDEVGFIVQQIDKTGMLKLRSVGGIWPHTALGVELKLKTREGKEFYGTFGSTSIHVLPADQRGKVMKFNDMFADFGFRSEEEIKEAGIVVGDTVAMQSEPRLLSDTRIMGKALDNKYGVAVIARAMEILAEENFVPKVRLHLVASAQEEVGSRGARTYMQKYRPDMAFSLDTCVSHDTPGIIPGDTKLDSGVAFGVMAGGFIAPYELSNKIVDIATKANVPAYKYISQGGGNDADILQYSQGGVPTISIDLPTRYLHAQRSVSSLIDYDYLVKFTVELIKNLTPEFITQYQK